MAPRHRKLFNRNFIALADKESPFFTGEPLFCVNSPATQKSRSCGTKAGVD
jgi:hypothetical protein